MQHQLENRSSYKSNDFTFQAKISAGYKRGESKEIDNHENETRIEKKSSWKGCFSADEKIQLVF